MPDDYIVFLQEHEFDIGAMEDDLINFHQALESFKFMISAQKVQF